jgi:hypothetical protein
MSEISGERMRSPQAFDPEVELPRLAADQDAGSSSTNGISRVVFVWYCA